MVDLSSVEHNIKNTFQNISAIDDILIYGSSTNSQNPKDVDAVIFLKGEKFQTQYKSYRDIAKACKESNFDSNVSLQIRSSSEIKADNFVTIPPEFYLNLKNTSRSIFDSGIVEEIKEFQPQFDKDSRKIFAFAFAYQLANRKKLLNNLLGHVSKPIFQVWHHGSYFLNIDLGTNANSRNYRRAFYEKVMPNCAKNKVDKLEKALTSIHENNDADSFFELVNLSEESMWILNELVQKRLISFR
jgi:hypothetical protein